MDGTPRGVDRERYGERKCCWRKKRRESAATVTRSRKMRRKRGLLPKRKG